MLDASSQKSPMVEKPISSQLAANKALAISAIFIGVVLWVSSTGEPSALRETRLQVDPNSAPAPVLDALPTLGKTRVSAIIKAREQRPFSSLDDLDRRIKGIGPAAIHALQPHLQIGEPTP